jgi:hypothetical protein
MSPELGETYKMAREEITGKSFSRLTAVRYIGKNKHSQPMWLFRCDCGNECTVVRAHAVSGHTKSCGCFSLETTVRRSTVHGHNRVKRRTAEYRAWANMHQRCSNEQVKNFNNYGGRGITVDPHWDSFENFIADLGPKPTPKHTLERIDNDLGYSKSNCRWATRREQANNTRDNRLLTVDGVSQTLAQWARETNISPSALYRRFTSGWHADWLLVPFPGMTFWEG